MKDNENRTDLYIIEHEDLPEREDGDGTGGKTEGSTRQNVWPLPASRNQNEDEQRKQVELDLIVKCKCKFLYYSPQISLSISYRGFCAENMDQFQDKKYKAEYL